MATEKRNIYQKVSDITESLGVIQKDSKAPDQMGGYKFISHGIVLAHLRHELTQNGVVVRPSGEEITHRDRVEKRTVSESGSERVTTTFYTAIKYKFTVVNADDPTDFFEDSWFGEGMDNADKGIQKAGTSAEKYYLMKLFKIGDKDDPDGIGENGETSTRSESASMRGAGSPGAFSQRAVAETRKADATPATSPPVNGETKEVTPDQYRNQMEALVWFGEQLPKDVQWFRGKVTAMVSLWDTKKKNKSQSESEIQAGSAIAWVFNQIAEIHNSSCGPNCAHMTAVELAVLTGGKITDPAK